MKADLARRLLRIEGRRVAEVEHAGLPEGMVDVMLFGIAVHLGGFPAPAQSPMEKDDVFTAVDRALGYPDASERRHHDAYDLEWVERCSAAAARLCLRIGLPSDATSKDEATLVAFAGMLDSIAEAHPEWGSSSAWPQKHPWPGLDQAFETWVRSVGHLPEAVRTLARCRDA